MEKERKKAEKQAKFEQKKKAQAATSSAAPAVSKNQEKKAKAEKKTEEEVLPAYVEDTPAGEKKCMSFIYNHACILLTQVLQI